MNTSSMPTDLPAAANRRRAISSYGGLVLIALLYCAISCVGITWGLPSRKIDKFLFDEGEVWSGEKIHRLARAGEKFSPDQRSRMGADVDRDPLFSNPRGTRPVGRQPVDQARRVLLTGTEEDVAKIYLRYRLYTYQPDEMITMMALAGMRPGDMQFDPRLYQYGGLFIYPVGALIKLCGILGLIDVRRDLVYYLDNPDEFGKFYIVARAYSAAWGLAGVFIVFATTRRLAAAIRTPSASRSPHRPVDEGRLPFSGNDGALPGMGNHLAGLLASLLFTLMPVVVCMAHEGKPHLPGAVLMLLAVYFAMRAIRPNRQSKIDHRKFFWLMCLTCGAATGMVLSSWPICILIPLLALIEYRSAHVDDRKAARAATRMAVGTFLAVAVYFMTNPYVLMNYFSQREILRSNFGNSLAMYEVDRIGEGFMRVLELTLQGATLPVVVIGFIALAAAIVRLRRVPQVWLAIVPAALFFTQFVLIGAGKPAEYGRFGIFTNTVLAIGSAILLTAPLAARIRAVRIFLPAIVVLWAGVPGFIYLRGFYRDTTHQASRLALARDIQTSAASPEDFSVALPAEPAPYVCPPLNFPARRVWLWPDLESRIPNLSEPVLFLRPLDDSISWADKTFLTTWRPGSN